MWILFGEEDEYRNKWTNMEPERRKQVGGIGMEA